MCNEYIEEAKVTLSGGEPLRFRVVFKEIVKNKPLSIKPWDDLQGDMTIHPDAEKGFYCIYGQINVIDSHRPVGQGQLYPNIENAKRGFEDEITRKYPCSKTDWL